MAKLTPEQLQHWVDHGYLVVGGVLTDPEAAIADLERFLQISKNEQWNETARELLASWGKVEMPASANADADS